MPGNEPTLIAINSVRADRAADFEEWIRSQVVPAIAKHRPDLDGRWRVLRAAEETDGVVTYGFVCEGGTMDDWDLSPLLEASLGPEGAERALADFTAMFTEEQTAWWFTPVRFDAVVG